MLPLVFKVLLFTNLNIPFFFFFFYAMKLNCFEHQKFYAAKFQSLERVH